MRSSKRSMRTLMLAWLAVTLPVAGISSYVLGSWSILVAWGAITAMVLGGLLAARIAAPETDDEART